MEIEERPDNNKRKIEDTSPEEEIPSKRPATVENVSLQHMPDQVMLEILKYLTVRELKALGYVDQRFAQIISDRTLWTVADSSGPIGVEQLHWMLTYGIRDYTKSIRLIGFAKKLNGCGGFMYCRRPVIQGPGDGEPGTSSNSGRKLQMTLYTNLPPSVSFCMNAGRARIIIANGRAVDNLLADGDDRNGLADLRPRHPRVSVMPHPNPRYAGNLGIYTTLPQWPTYVQRRLHHKDEPTKNIGELNGCAGPQFTLIYPLLRKMEQLSPNLQELYLEYCNLNHDTIKISHFPKHLKKLSLKGSMLFNSSNSGKPFLHRIYSHISELEMLDVSECLWLEPDYIMTFSKLPKLKELRIRYCKNMKDYVAYASLATKHGFRQLEILDYTGSPVSDSEVSPLGWLANLKELILSPAPEYTQIPKVHLHYKDDPVIVKRETEEWENHPPSYYPLPEKEELYDYKPGTVAPTKQLDSNDKETTKDTSKDEQETKKDNNKREIEDYYINCVEEDETEKPNNPSGVDFADFIVASDNDDKLNSIDSELDNDLCNLNEGFFLRDVVGPVKVEEGVSSDLISDSAIRYFGQANDVNFVHINQRGQVEIADEENSYQRPPISPLERLTVRGFINITNLTLTHLLKTAPKLVYLDLRRTKVTRPIVEYFLSIRPHVEILWDNP